AWAKHILRNTSAQHGMEIFAGLEQIPEKPEEEQEVALDEDLLQDDPEIMGDDTIMRGFGISETPTKKEELEIEKRMMRLNCNLDHPSIKTLYKFLKASGAPLQDAFMMALNLDEGPGLASVIYRGQQGREVTQLFKRSMTTLATLDPERPNDELISWAVDAIYSVGKVGNHSPFERVMGVAGMSASSKPFANTDGGTGETQEQRRLLARKSFLGIEFAERRRRAEHAWNRISQTWHPEDLVNFWRAGQGLENRPGKKCGWYGPARVLVQEKRHMDGRTRPTSVIRCAPEQLRAACEAEKVITELQRQVDRGKTMPEILETAKTRTVEDLLGQGRPDLQDYDSQ
ncbi:unnamed protein product, partial [Prorocentrum cordatum]